MRIARTAAATTYLLNDGMTLRIGKQEKGFTPMHLIDKDGDRIAITMHQLLTAVSAVYTDTKERAK